MQQPLDPPATHTTPRRFRLAGTLALLWLAFVLYGTSLPFDFDVSHRSVQRGWQHARWKLFRDPDGSAPSRSDLVSNVLLFVPVGLLVYLWLAPPGVWRPGALIGALGVAALTSAAVELAQLASPSRCTSATDWVTNVGGAMLGAVGGAIYNRWLRRVAMRRARFLAARQTVRLAMILYVGVLVVAQLTPWDVSIDWSDLKKGFKRTNIVLWHTPPQRRYWWQVFREMRGLEPVTAGAPVSERLRTPAQRLNWTVVQARSAWLFAIAAFLITYSRRRYSGSGLFTAAAWGCIGTLLLSVLIEVLQWGIVSSRTDVSDVAVAGLGALCGAAAGAVYLWRLPTTHPEALRRARRLAGAVMIAFVVLHLADSARPFEFAQPARPVSERVIWVPFQSHYRYTGMQAARDLLGATFAFLPIGFMAYLLIRTRRPDPAHAAVERATRRAVGRTLLMSLLVAVWAETVQFWLPARYPDTTDLLCAVVGAWLGTLLCRWYLDVEHRWGPPPLPASGRQRP